MLRYNGIEYSGDATDFIGITNVAIYVWVKQTNHCRNICTYAYCVLGIIELKVFIRSQRIRQTGIHQVSRIFRF